jgi:hypothetical protein
MKAFIKIVLLLLVLLFSFPAIISALDMMCWFYTSATCTGLDYGGVRPIVVLCSTFIAMAIFFWLTLTL